MLDGRSQWNRIFDDHDAKQWLWRRISTLETRMNIPQNWNVIKTTTEKDINVFLSTFGFEGQIPPLSSGNGTVMNMKNEEIIEKINEFWQRNSKWSRRRSLRMQCWKILLGLDSLDYIDLVVVIENVIFFWSEAWRFRWYSDFSEFLWLCSFQSKFKRIDLMPSWQKLKGIKPSYRILFAILKPSEFILLIFLLLVCCNILFSFSFHHPKLSFCTSWKCLLSARIKSLVNLCTRNYYQFRQSLIDKIVLHVRIVVTINLYSISTGKVPSWHGGRWKGGMLISARISELGIAGFSPQKTRY